MAPENIIPIGPVGPVGTAQRWLGRKREEKALMHLVFEKDAFEMLHWFFEFPMGLYIQAGMQGKQQWAAKKKAEQKLTRQLKRWFNQVALKGETKPEKMKITEGWTGALPQASVDILKEMAAHYAPVGDTAPFIPMYLSLMDTLNGEVDQTVRELADYKGVEGKLPLVFTKDGLTFLRQVLEAPVVLYTRAGVTGKQQWQAKDKAAQKQVRRLRKWFTVNILGDLKDTSDVQIETGWTGPLPTDAVDRLREIIEHYENVGMMATYCSGYVSLLNTLTGEVDDEDALLGYTEPQVEAAALPVPAIPEAKS